MPRSSVHHGRFARQVVLVALVAVGGCQAAVPGPVATTSPSATQNAPATVAAKPTVAPSLATAAPSPAPVDLQLFGTFPGGTLGGTRAAAMQRVLDKVVHDGAPDVIAAVITADGSWSGAAGIGGPDGRKATAKDEFAIASVTKTITATLLMRLAEQGKIDLDAPLAKYLDGLSDANGATVRQALAMRSGMADFGPDAATAIGADPAHHWTLAELVRRFPDAVGTPDYGYVKSGPGYILLAAAAAHVTGGSFAKALRTEILDPVGASRILEQAAGADTPKPWALPTAEHLGQFTVADLGAGGAISCISSASFGPGSGSIASDAPSLAAWTWHLFAGDIVSRESLAAMVPGADGHGLGLDALESPLARAIGLTGGKTGYGTVLAIVPAEQTVAVVLVNDENFRIDSYIADLIRAGQG